MAQISVMKFEVDIKSSPERFYQAFTSKSKMLPKMTPNLIKGVELIKGDWNSLGSVKKWTLASPDHNSSPQVSSYLTEAMDEKNNSITMKVIDGDFLKLYSFYRFTIQATAKGGGQGSGSTVKVTLEYEKLNPHVPEPTNYCEYGTVLYKSIDSYLLKNE